ncbi:PIG-L family deacetylase [Photobacterium galatheae]|uniref:PIG-L deacetylase family protein n=1 Tax=Photobacterium galatheae TaxID=1654360 RepID=UPI00202CD635|nr:PIG-L deacetylase family protein [Photobacterium galatheae]MCM0147574.1 PIG-L family deacetylase [Photobacterium galatheae]
MSKRKVLFIAPHADDETLGCGGTILKLHHLGYELHWLIVTGMTNEAGFNDERIATRKKEIDKVTKEYNFSSVHQLNLPPAKLDTLPKGEIVGRISATISEIKPEQVFTVYRNDVHSDHEVVFDATISATKSFRYPFIKKIFVYETISETDFGLKPEDGGFRPNVYFDISDFIHKKNEILEIYESEIGDFPFPRSKEAIQALAMLRGVQCNSKAAEAFMLVKEIL